MKNWMLLVMFIFLLAGVFAVPATTVHFFYSTTCPHCENVIKSGVLESVSQIPNVVVERYEISSKENRDLFLKMAANVSAPESIPLAIIEKNGNSSYLLGDNSIINNLEYTVRGGDVNVGFFDKIKVFLEKEFIQNVDSNTGKLTFLGILILVIIALVDSINPCAFGVLIFLMAGLLAMGSPKRALKAGLLYSFVIFVAYFLAGVIITKTLITFQQYINPVLMIVGILVFVGGLIELKDFFWYGKGFSLRIPDGIKPKIEKLIHRGTLPAILILGILVALVELPCTGGVYLVILSIMAKNNFFAISYLALYNIVFILPLVVITFIIYKGTGINSIKSWIEKNKKYMRLATGIIMVLLAIYLIRIA